MFSATKIVVAGVIVALFGGFLLAGVLTQQPSEDLVPGAPASASASAQDADALVSSNFQLRITGYREGERPGMSHLAEGHADTGPVTVTGLALVGNEEEGWVDPRALGSMTEVWTRYDVIADDGIAVGRGSTKVENDGGAWAGTAERYAIGYGVEVGTVVWELVGEDDYEGLTMFLWGEYEHQPDVLTGIIVPSDSVPGFPRPPPDTGAD